MLPLEPIPGNQGKDGEEEEEDSEEEYDSDAHLWNAGNASSVGSNLLGRAQAQVGKILSGLSGATGTPRTSSTKTQMIGGGTTQAEEKMTKMVKAKSTFTGTM